MNKRGQALSTSAIIFIVLGVTALVVMAIGFSAGWNKILPFASQENNVDQVASGCEIACQTSSEEGYCDLKRKVILDDDHSFEGTCNDLTKNPSLGIVSCGGLCSDKPSYCMIEDQKDSNCDGIADSEASEEKETSQTYDGIIFFDEDSGIIQETPSSSSSGSTSSTDTVGDTATSTDSGATSETTGETTYSTQSYDSPVLKAQATKTRVEFQDCKANLSNRKAQYKIPEKMCYWQTMTELYDKKCDNLDREDIAEIFEKKETYRKILNPEWPTLNTDGDFCVKVYYDCDTWASVKIQHDLEDSVLGAHIGNKIYVNPNVELLPEEVSQILIHEALHSVQDSQNRYEKSRLFDLDPDDPNFLKDYPQYKAIDAKYKTFYNTREFLKTFLTVQWKDFLRYHNERKNKCDDVTCNLILVQEYEQREADFNYISRVVLNPQVFKFEKDISSGNYFYWLFVGENTDGAIWYKQLKQSMSPDVLQYAEKRHYYNYVKYVEELVELDPRLSEVNRWWLDQTSPNCEIIYDASRAAQVMAKFLAASDQDLGPAYAETRDQLKMVLDVAKEQNLDEKVYNQMALRLPGLAKTEPSPYADFGDAGLA